MFRYKVEKNIKNRKNKYVEQFYQKTEKGIKELIVVFIKWKTIKYERKLKPKSQYNKIKNTIKSNSELERKWKL